MPMEAHAQSFTHHFTKEGDSHPEIECSTQSGDHGRVKHRFMYEVYSVEETWEQDPFDGSDSDAESCVNNWQHIRRGPCSQYIGLSSCTPQVVWNSHQDAACPTHAVREQQANHRSNSDVEPPEARKKNCRPCKARRQKFQRLIDHMKAKVRQELEHFDIDSVQLPKGLAADPRAVATVRSMMEQYQKQVLQGEVPTLDAISSKKSASRSFGVPIHLSMYLAR